MTVLSTRKLFGMNLSDVNDAIGPALKVSLARIDKVTRSVWRRALDGNRGCAMFIVALRP